MSTPAARILASIAATSPKAPTPVPAKSEPDWINIDPASLSPDLAAALDAYRAASKAASDLRKAFEDAMTLAIDPLDTERVIFGYRFGKLSLAIVPAEKPKRPASAISLAAFKAR